MYGKNLHMNSPNIKLRRTVPIRVTGMQNTPSSISDIARFRRNRFVIVLMRRFCISVSITRKLPMTARKNIHILKDIWKSPIPYAGFLIEGLFVAFNVVLRELELEISIILMLIGLFSTSWVRK